MKIPELLTISIASKDRPEVVEATLRKIHAFGLGDCPLILCDDGSSPLLDPPALALFARARLIRNETAEGQALARNRIAKACSTLYLLQLDDDSYPVAGSLEKLIKTVAREEEWLAVAIPFEEPARGRGFPAVISKERQCSLKSFVGCSVLLNVRKFNRLGGYASWIERTVEEEELCIRAYCAGLKIVTVGGFGIRHDVSDVGRDEVGIAWRSIRNWTIVWLIYTPLLYLPIRLARMFFASVKLSIKLRSLMPLMGFGAAFRRFFLNRMSRHPLKRSVYRAFLSAPHALALYLEVEESDKL